MSSILSDDKLKEVANAMRRFKNQSAAARHLNLPRKTFTHRLERAAERGFYEGWVKQSHTDTLTDKQVLDIPDGHIVERTTTQYTFKDAESGLKINQFIKTKAARDEDKVIDWAELFTNVKPLPKIEPTTSISNSKVMFQLTLSDLHVGMKAWNRETLGGDWDLEICEQIALQCVKYAVDNAPNADRALLVNLGDYFHYDGLKAVTPRSGHILDADSRYGKMIKVGNDIFQHTIEMMAAKFKQLDVWILPGNHDESTALAMRDGFSRIFTSSEHISINDSDSPYYCLQFGNNMIGAHHGHIRKRVDLPRQYSIMFPKEWGECSNRFIHSGHLHTLLIEDKGGAWTIQHPTVASQDAHGLGFDKTIRGLLSNVYHYDFGSLGMPFTPYDLFKSNGESNVV